MIEVEQGIPVGYVCTGMAFEVAGVTMCDVNFGINYHRNIKRQTVIRGYSNF